MIHECAIIVKQLRVDKDQEVPVAFMKNRKNLNLILALLFIFTFFLSACKKDSDADNLPTIILDTQSDAEADISSATEYESTHENSSPSPQVDNIQEIVRSTPMVNSLKLTA